MKSLAVLFQFCFSCAGTCVPTSDCCRSAPVAPTLRANLGLGPCAPTVYCRVECRWSEARLNYHASACSLGGIDGGRFVWIESKINQNCDWNLAPRLR